MFDKYDQNNWNNLETLKSASFICGYCGSKTGNNKGYGFYEGYNKPASEYLAIYICPNCGRPIFKEFNMFTPSAIYGRPIDGLPEDIGNLYEEARNSYQVRAYTGVVLICRKLLANVAIHYGAKERLKFVQYIDYLVENGYVPPKSKNWVTKIKNEGNKITHLQKCETQEKAKQILDLVEMLLLINFKFNDEYNSNN